MIKKILIFLLLVLLMGGFFTVVLLGYKPILIAILCLCGIGLLIGLWFAAEDIIDEYF